jgi:hypothetical protein
MDNLINDYKKFDYSKFKLLDNNQFTLLIEDKKEFETSTFDIVLYKLGIEYELQYLEKDILEYTFSIRDGMKIINIVHDFKIDVLDIKR